MTTNKFDPETHKYTIDGIEVPSVTKILEDVGISDFSKANPEAVRAAQEHGKAVHFITEIFDNKQWDKYEMDKSAVKIRQQWIKAVNKITHGEKMLYIIECPIFSTNLGFAGTPDRVYLRHNKAGEFYSAIIVDIKSCIDISASPIQLAGYEILVREKYPNVQKVLRKTVQLSLDLPEPKVTEHKSLLDKHIFLSALNVYRFKHHKRRFL